MLHTLALSLALIVPAVLDSLPHRSDHFTQGLFWEKAKLWESTGLEGHSGLYKMDSKGHILDSLRLPYPHFGEGAVMAGGRISWLTWKSHVGFTVEPGSMRFSGQFPLPTEGWGITLWRDRLVVSNGSSELLLLSPGDHRVTGSVRVRAKGLAVENLNELEMVGDTLYANVWQSDSIAVIAMPSGEVSRWMDMSALARAVRKRSPRAEVLNGIAWDGAYLWVTGKFWPQVYKLRQR